MAEQLENLQQLAEKLQEQIKQTQAELEILNQDIAINRQKLQDIQNDAESFTTPKILTRKQIADLKREKEEKEKEKILFEKQNIDSILKAELEAAENIIKNIDELLPEEKEKAYQSMVQAKVKALEHATEVNLSVIKDKKILAEDLLVSRAINNSKSSNISQNSTKKHKHKRYKNVNDFKKSESILTAQYVRLQNEIQTIEHKVFELQNQIENLSKKK